TAGRPALAQPLRQPRLTADEACRRTGANAGERDDRSDATGTGTGLPGGETRPGKLLHPGTPGRWLVVQPGARGVRAQPRGAGRPLPGTEPAAGAQPAEAAPRQAPLSRSATAI